MAASENEALAIKHARFGIVPQVKCYGVTASGIVDLLQTLIADGDEFRLVVGRTR